MMGVSDADARAMSLHDYEMRLWHWNEIHGSDRDGEITDPAITQKIIDELNSRPDLMQTTKGQKRPAMPARLTPA